MAAQALEQGIGIGQPIKQCHLAKGIGVAGQAMFLAIIDHLHAMLGGAQGTVAITDAARDVGREPAGSDLLGSGDAVQPRHLDVEILGACRIEARVFGGWSMTARTLSPEAEPILDLLDLTESFDPFCLGVEAAQARL